MTVATPTTAVLAMRDARRLPIALMGGTVAMRAAGRTYLPQERAESNESYDNRLARSFLFNGYRKTVRDMASKVFAKPIVVSEDMASDLVKDAENIDLAGRNLDMFGHAVLVDGMANGISYILVDADKPILNEDGTLATLTRAESEGLNRRPWMVHIESTQVLGWRSETVDGIEKLTQFRFMEAVTEQDGEFNEKNIQQVRVFSRTGPVVTWQIYRQAENAPDGTERWILYDQGPVSISEIALVPVYINRTGFMQGVPPLSDLAEVNQSHWQSQSDQRNILHVARVPILFGSGFEEQQGGKLEIGGSRMITVSNSDASLGYVEHTGQAIGAGRQDLKDLEFQMQVLGLELLIPVPGGQTATGEAIDQAHMNTPLAMMAMSLEGALEKSFEFMAEYSGLSSDSAGSLTVNKDFGISLRGAKDVASLISMVKEGIISRETCIMEMKRRGVISDDVNAEEEVLKALMESEATEEMEGENEEEMLDPSEAAGE